MLFPDFVVAEEKVVHSPEYFTTLGGLSRQAEYQGFQRDVY